MSAAASWRAEGALGGQFFFSMANIDTPNTEKFCSTMARDLVQHIPDVAMHVANAVKRNPSAISADGSRIASSSQACTIRLWDAEAGQALGRPLLGHIKCVQGVAFSPYGSQFVSCSGGHTVRLWDAETGQTLGAPLRGHKHWIHTV